VIWLTAGWLLNIVWSFQMTVGRKGLTSGLPFAFILSTTFLYIGFIAYLNPNYTHIRRDGSAYLAFYDFTSDTVMLGTLASLLALTFFNIGAFLSRYGAKRPKLLLRPGELILDPSFRTRFLTGLFLFGIAGFTLSRVQIPIPLIDAIQLVGRNSAVVLICLGPALILLSDGKTSYGRWFAAGMAIPAAYIVLLGFVSYGFIVFCCVLAFYLAFLRKKRLKIWQFLVAGLGTTYLFLSAFIAWMSFRDTLREMIATGSTFEQRIEALWQAALSIRLLNWSDLQSLDLLMIRLNQYIFVGKAIEMHTANPSLRLGGETIWVSAFAWIPRFLWPGKPEMNTNQFMRDHTGIEFTDRAAFGNGPVMEYYVNFGWAGIVIGFLILGFVLARIDRRASLSLRSGRLLDFVKWFAVGIALIAPLTSLFFMVNTAIMTYLIFSSIQYIIGPLPIRFHRATLLVSSRKAGSRQTASRLGSKLRRGKS